jgi:hypothetical protein
MEYFVSAEGSARRGGEKLSSPLSSPLFARKISFRSGLQKFLDRDPIDVEEFIT